MRSREGAVTVAAGIAGAGALATLLVYLAVLRSEDEPGQLTSSRVVFIAVLLACAAGLALVAPFIRAAIVRAAMLDCSAFTLIVLTVLGAMSIGIMLLLPALCALFAAGRESARLPLFDAWTLALTAAVLVAATAALGLSLSSTS